MAAITTNTISTTDCLFESEEEEMQGQLQAWSLALAFVSSMAVKVACKLRIPDILAAQGRGGALTLHQIASHLSSLAPDLDFLHRILTFLCANGVFSITRPREDSASSEPKYGLTATSKWLLQESINQRNSLAPLCLLLTSEALQAPWHHLSDCVLNCGQPFEYAHETHVWNFANQHPEFNKLFNDTMACNSNILMKCLLQHYHGFGTIETIVDVGGGVGTAASWIVARYPSIKAINFDLPHVIATAPSYPGVTHFAGDMFHTNIPPADAIFMKWILHCCGDEDCINILKNCRKALPDTGKVIIVDAILKKGNPFSDVRIAFDLAIMAATPGGKERTQQEWETLLQRAGFPRCTFVDLPAIQCVIEAFPN